MIAIFGIDKILMRFLFTLLINVPHANCICIESQSVVDYLLEF